MRAQRTVISKKSHWSVVALIVFAVVATVFVATTSPALAAPPDGHGKGPKPTPSSSPTAAPTEPAPTPSPSDSPDVPPPPSALDTVESAEQTATYTASHAASGARCFTSDDVPNGSLSIEGTGVAQTTTFVRSWTGEVTHDVHCMTP